MIRIKFVDFKFHLFQHFDKNSNPFHFNLLDNKYYKGYMPHLNDDTCDLPKASLCDKEIDYKNRKRIKK